MKRSITYALLAATMSVVACDSSDDDNTSDGMQSGNNGGQTPVLVGDLRAIAAQDANSDPVLLDTDSLNAQGDALFGEADAGDPFDVEDGDTVQSVLERQ